MSAGDVIQPKISYVGDGSVRVTTTWENSLVVSYNVSLCTFYYIMNQQFQSQIFALEK